VLASILIWFGDAAATAIERVRKAQPHAIQSAAQQRFLHDFADRIRGWR
jgi:atypical dual specificity phosphatase